MVVLTAVVIHISCGEYWGVWTSKPLLYTLVVVSIGACKHRSFECTRELLSLVGRECCVLSWKIRYNATHVSSAQNICPTNILYLFLMFTREYLRLCWKLFAHEQPPYATPLRPLLEIGPVFPFPLTVVRIVLFAERVKFVTSTHNDVFLARHCMATCIHKLMTALLARWPLSYFFPLFFSKQFSPFLGLAFGISFYMVGEDYA